MLPPFDFAKHSCLEFFPPDFEKFPSLLFAYQALKQGKSCPCFLNAANEVLVERFLKKEISWMGILRKLEHLLAAHHAVDIDSKESIFEVDREARERAVVV